MEQQKLTIEQLQLVWKNFSDIPVDNNDCIERDFFIWEAGTDKYDIWGWLDEKCPNGLVEDLLN